MFAASKTANTSLPPIILGGENSVSFDQGPLGGAYSLSFDADNSDNIGIGDFILVTVVGTTTFSHTTPSDFTALSSPFNQVKYFYAVFDGTEITLDLSGFQNNDAYVIQYAWFKNVDTTNPIDVAFSSTFVSGTPQNIDPAALTTLTNNAVVVSGVTISETTSSTSAQDQLSTPSNLISAGTAYAQTGASGGGLAYTRIDYATVETAGSFDPLSYGTPTVSYNTVYYTYWTLALKPANPVTQEDVTNFNVGNSFFVSNSDYINNTYEITVDADTIISGNKTVGLGDVVLLAVARYGSSALYSVSTTDFTELYGDDSTGTYEARIYYAVFTGTPITLSVNRFSIGSNQPFVYHLLSVRYPNETTTFDVSITTKGFIEVNATSNPQTLVVDSDAVTTNTDNAIVLNGLLLGGGGDSGLGVSAPDLSAFLDTPSNMATAASELSAGTGSNPDVTYTAAAYAKVSTAGTFDPATWGTVTVQPDQNVFGTSYTLAIKPR